MKATIPINKQKHLPVEVKMIKRNVLVYIKTIVFCGVFLALIPFPGVNKNPEHESGNGQVVAISNINNRPFAQLDKPVYDYSKMLSLIEQCRQIRNDFYDPTFVPTKIDFTMTNNLLKQLISERYTLRDYVEEIKTDHNMKKQFFSLRKYRALRYYNQILSMYIKGLRTIQSTRIRRFKNLWLTPIHK